MDGINLIQDLAIVLLAAGMAGMLCKRIGLSVIVGYLAAGILIGPYTPPFSFITDVERVQTLSQIGLVILMFAIGLGLSFTKLKRLGLPALLATGLGAFFVLNLTQALGHAVGWSPLQSMFIASMFMCSSSAVIAKVVSELKLNHEGSAQRALGMTVMEDVVAVVMLTILASQTQGSVGDEASIGQLLTTMSAFVVLLAGAGLLIVPRLFRRMEMGADPELQTIIVAGLLFLLAISAAKAGYSLALGAFLLGAIIAEMPQKMKVENTFSGMRDIFSSVFFVSIGMMIEVQLLFSVWHWILGLFLFVMVARPLSTGFAMILCGTPPAVARKASLLLSPLGEFSFIIAQIGVAAAVLPKEYYPMAVGVSILTVLTSPIINRHADAILKFNAKWEPRWITQTLDAYSDWIAQIKERQMAPAVWKLIRVRVIQIGVECLVITGLLIFSPLLFSLFEEFMQAIWFEQANVGFSFWGVIGLIALILLVSIWRNVLAISLIFAESVGNVTRLSPKIISHGFNAFAATTIGYWLYGILPIESLPSWGWGVIVAVTLIVVVVYSHRLVYWHSNWQSSMQEVLQGESANADQQADYQQAMHQRLEDWNLKLSEFNVPINATYTGQVIADLDLPARFNCFIAEIERNGYVIPRVTSQVRVYPGDTLLLLGTNEAIAAVQEFLAGSTVALSQPIEEFKGTVLDTMSMPAGPRAGNMLKDLQITRSTGVRIVGIQRGEKRILNPAATHVIESGDLLLVVGTLDELNQFRHWIAETEK